MLFTVKDSRHSKMLTFLQRELQINPQKKNPGSSWDSSPTPSEYQSDALTIRPLGPLAEEQKTCYISSIA